MNRQEFQRWLDQFPEDTIIEVIVQDEPSNYQSYGAGVETVFEAVEFDQYSYVDLTGNEFIDTNSSSYNKRTLTLGSEC